MGACIEILSIMYEQLSIAVASYMGAWIEILLLSKIAKSKGVASYMGAWIEISDKVIFSKSIMSHPIWVRGLKYSSYIINCQCFVVASYMGAWIEMVPLGCMMN